MDFLKDIILQLCFIIIPIYLYQLLWFDRFPTSVPNPNRYFIGFFSSVSVICCMTYPIPFYGDYLYDLRSIPLIIAILYGGYIVGIITTFIMFIYRLYLGGDGIFVTLIAYSLYAVLPFIISSRWYTFTRRTKILFIAGIGIIKSFSSIIGLVFILYITGKTAIIPALHSAIESANIIFYTTLINVICFIVICLLCEHIREVSFLRSQVYQSEKFNVVSELAASVAHEVRNPLTVVRGFVQLLNDPNDDKKQGFTRLVISELDRAESIISDYLNLAKPQLRSVNKVNVSTLLTDVKTILEPYALIRGTEIELRSEDELGVMADQLQLKQVFLNIIKNGIESIEQAGKVWINASLEGKFIVIKVKDTGIGMTAEQLKRLGQPYYSTKDKGTGLGLLVTYRIIHSIKGHIQFKSEKAKGTEATIFLPYFK